MCTTSLFSGIGGLIWRSGVWRQKWFSEFEPSFVDVFRTPFPKRAVKKGDVRLIDDGVGQIHSRFVEKWTLRGTDGIGMDRMMRLMKKT